MPYPITPYQLGVAYQSTLGVALEMIVAAILRTKIGRKIEARLIDWVLEVDSEAPIRELERQLAKFEKENAPKFP